MKNKTRNNKTYEVVIKGSVTKTIKVKAADENDAVEFAHQKFDVGHQKGIPEDYDEEVIEVERVE